MTRFSGAIGFYLLCVLFSSSANAAWMTYSEVFPDCENCCSFDSLKEYQRIRKVTFEAWLDYTNTSSLQTGWTQASKALSKQTHVADFNGGAPQGRLSVIVSTIEQLTDAKAKKELTTNISDRLNSIFSPDSLGDSTIVDGVFTHALSEAVSAVETCEKRLLEREGGLDPKTSQLLQTDSNYENPEIERTAADYLTPATVTSQPPANPTAMPYTYPTVKKITFDGTFLGKCLGAVTRSKFPKHSLTKAAMKMPYNQNDFIAYLDADGRIYDYGTGQEPRLRAWVLQQPENSIDPISIYEKSMEINQGNIWNAFLTIHQLLRNEARWWDSSRYHYKSSSALEHRFFDKFIDIRGDLAERGGVFHGDLEGSWYRFWGVALAKLSSFDEPNFAQREASDVPECLTIPNPTTDFFPTLAHAGIVYQIYMIEHGKKEGMESDAAGKTAMDHAGLDLSTGFVDELWGKSEVDLSRCQSRAYLK